MTEPPLGIARADDPDYYLHNFFLVLGHVLARDAHLFTPEERDVFEALRGMDEGPRRLYVRLSNRKGPFFLVDRLIYAEIPDPASAAGALVAAGFASPGAEGDGASEVLRLYTVPELKEACRALDIPLPRPARREAFVDAITVAFTEARPAVEAALAAHGPRISLCHQGLIDRVVRLFFLNAYQGPGTLVAVDLAHVTFPAYQVRRSRPVFASRAELLAWEGAREDASRLMEALAAGDGEAAGALAAAAIAALEAPPPLDHPFLARFSAPWVQAGTLDALGHALERAGDHAGAAALYGRLLSSPLRPRRRGGWWERRVTDLSHLGAHAQALDAAEAALADPWLEDHRRPAMEGRRARLAKKAGRAAPPPSPPFEPPVVTWEGEILSSGPRQHTLFRGASGGPVRVERLALERAAAEGWSGTGAENALYTHLFALLLWDVMFMDVPDVFQTPFQDAPLDLRTEAFFPSREGAIRARLDALRAGEAPALLTRARAWEGQAARGAVWGAWSFELLGEICQVLGGAALAVILGALARDYGRASRGLPDLLLWRGGRARLVEVKGPGDRLSAEQRAWMARLSAAGIDVAVGRVVAVDPPVGPGEGAAQAAESPFTA